MSQLGQMSGRVRELGAEPIAIAVTATFSQMAFGEALGVDFPMLSDWEGSVSSDYGVQYEVWKGHQKVAKRSVFIVDRNNRIRYRWVTDDALLEPNLEEAIAVVERLDLDSSAPQSVPH